MRLSVTPFVVLLAAYQVPDEVSELSFCDQDGDLALHIDFEDKSVIVGDLLVSYAECDAGSGFCITSPLQLIEEFPENLEYLCFEQACFERRVYDAFSVTEGYAYSVFGARGVVETVANYSFDGNLNSIYFDGELYYNCE